MSDIQLLQPAQEKPGPFLSYQHFISQAPFAIVLMQGESLLIELANDHAFSLWGKRKEKVLHKTVLEAFPELAAQGFMEILKNVYDTGQRFVANEQPVTLLRNGLPETLYINFSYDPLRNDDGSIVGIMGIGHDVTDLVLARQKEKEAETMLRNLVDQTPAPLLILKGEELRLEVANESLFELWGTDRNAIGKPFLEILPEMKEQVFTELLRNVLQTGEAYYGYATPGYFMRKNGQRETRYFDFVYQPYREENGSITGIIVLATDVTKRMATEKSLEESEKNFRHMILQAPIAMCVLKGPEHVVEIANDPMYELWGRGKEELLNKPVFTGLPEGRGQGLEGILDQVYATGERSVANERALTLPKNGVAETMYVNFVYEPLREGGSVTGIMALAIDVTEQVEARRRIEIAEERARLAIESADMGTFDVDLQTDAIISSPRLEAIYDVPPGSTRAVYADSIIDEDKPVRKEAYKRAVHSGILHYESRVRWKDGSLHWVKLDGRVFNNEEGVPTKLLGVAQDVTEQKNFQAALQAKHEELEMITQVMPQMVWAKYADGYTYFFNKRWSGFTGMKTEDLLGWGWMDSVHPDDRERVKAVWKETMESGTTYATEYRLRSQNGEYKWFLAKGIAVKDEAGKVKRWYGATTDIHIQKSQSAQLETLVGLRTEELRRSNEELEQYAHVTSHDMKEPIRKAKLFANRLRNEYGSLLPEKGVAYLERVETATDRLTSMVEGVLNYSTVNSFTQNISPVRLADVIRNIETDLELLIQSKNATIEYGELPLFDGAELLIYQLFYNLLNNSLKFIDGSRHPLITIESIEKKGSEFIPLFDANENESYVQVTVHDNGIGFNAEQASQIFNTFTRLNPKDQFEGTGMGLALVKRIVTRHRGYVYAEGEAGKGASFIVILPKSLQKLS